MLLLLVYLVSCIKKLGKIINVVGKGQGKVMENEFYKVIGTMDKASCARPG